MDRTRHLRFPTHAALFFALCGHSNLIAQTHIAADLAHSVLAANLDPAQCYHVRDIQLHQGDVTFYLTEGYLILGKSVNGRPLSAVFTTDVDGGDGEVVLLPPDRAERRTLATFTGVPNLDEHFTQAIFFFTDRTAGSLVQQLQSNTPAERIPELGMVMAERWNPAVTSLISNFDSRIVLDLLTKSQSGDGFFEAALRGRKLGDFDIVRDARAAEQIGAGKVTVRDGKAYWETWTRFVAADRRNLPPRAPEEEILAYNIQASMNASLTMHCVTRMRVRATADSRTVMPFELDGAMRAISARVDGAPVEIYQHDSLRNGLVQSPGNQLLLVVPPQPLEPGSEHDVEIVHEGNVVEDTGNQIYSVSARGTWYPARGSQFAIYDVTYSYPDTLDLVSAGAVKEDHDDNGVRTTHRIPEGKLRLLGFNLGRYTTRKSSLNGITLEVSANRTFEASLRPPPPAPIVMQSPGPATRARQQMPQIIQPAPLPMDPSDRVDVISNEILAAVDYFRSRFGEPPLNHIEVSPVTGRFGQGFAGMIYLPTLTYLNPADTPTRVDSPIDQVFMDQLLPAHEAAHQWWGNVVATDSYHHEWLMESVANYSALMFLESEMGTKALEKALDLYRDELLAKGPDGATAESRGPVVEGRRLESSGVPGAADAVLYGKGTWIVHMLRRRLGDANFLRMLAELRRRYEWKTVTTDEFRQLCAEFLPAGSSDPKLIDFFDQWVYDTGVPTLKLTYTVVGRKLSGTITQTDAPDDFTVQIPVEIRAGAAKPVMKLIRTTNGDAKFTLDNVASGAKAVLDPAWSVLRR